jgi:hypothetical protein
MRKQTQILSAWGNCTVDRKGDGAWRKVAMDSERLNYFSPVSKSLSNQIIPYHRY